MTKDDQGSNYKHLVATVEAHKERVRLTRRVYDRVLSGAELKLLRYLLFLFPLDYGQQCHQIPTHKRGEYGNCAVETG